MNPRRLVPALLALLCLGRSDGQGAESPEDGQVEATAAGIALGSGDWPEAIAHADRALQIWPEHGDLLVLRGIARYHAGEFRPALADLNAALATTTRYRPRALLYAGLAGIAVGEDTVASRALLELLREFPTSSEAQRLQALVPSSTPTPGAVHSAIPTWWSGQASLAVYRDDDPRQAVRTGASAVDGDATSTDLLAMAAVSGDFIPPESALGVHLEGTWATYEQNSEFRSATLAAGVIVQGSPWTGAWATALATGREERYDQQSFGRGWCGALRLRQETSGRTSLEASGQLRWIRHAEPWTSLDGPEASGQLRAAVAGESWWCQELSLTAELDRTVDRYSESSVSHARWGGDWRLGHRDRVGVIVGGSVEHRLDGGDDNIPAPRRLIEGTASLWIPLTRSWTWFASATGQWAQGEASPDRTLVGTGVAIAW